MAEDFPQARRITLVLDNLSTPHGASLDKLEWMYTPQHGSWLHMAELAFSVLSRPCLDRRIADLETLREQVRAWTEQRNRARKAVHWRFTTADARVKLPHLYPVIKD